MDSGLWAAIIGVGAGAFGYWFSTFSVQPILRYKDVRSKILRDFIYFAQVVNAENLSDEMKALYRERVLENRRSSAELSATLEVLPGWYLWYLQRKGHQLARAASRLISYSNNTEWIQAHELENSIRRDLGLPVHE